MLHLAPRSVRAIASTQRFLRHKPEVGVSCSASSSSNTHLGWPLRAVQTQAQLTPSSSTNAVRGKGPNEDLLRFLVTSFAHERDKAPARLLPFKEHTFRRAIQSIQKFKTPITSSKQAREIEGVGGGIARRIDEYFLSCAKRGDERTINAEVVDEARRSLTIKEFTRIYGVGETKAEKLYDAGCRTLEDIERLGMLKTFNRATQVAYRYVDYLDKNVTREQAETVKDAIELNLGSDFDVHLVGAIRRGLADAPLIELLVFHPHYVHVPTPSSSSSSSRKGKARQRDESTLSLGLDEPPAPPKCRGRPKRIATIAQERQDTFLADEVLKRLKGCNIIEATISETGRKWSGVVRVESEDGGVLFRRMELHLLPARSKGAALLALTGDRPFLAYIASAAWRLGYELNEFGLWCWRGNGTSNNNMDDTPHSDAETDEATPDGEKQSAGNVSNGHNGDGKGYWELIASTSEEGIFEELGLQFVVPERRNFAFISPGERKVRQRA